MKYIILFCIIVLDLLGSVIRTPVVAVNKDASEVTIEVKKIDVGMSGFVVHNIDKEHTTILKNAVVKSFDAKSGKAEVSLSPFNALSNSSLPNGKWSVKIGDTVLFAFGYTRGLFIAPSEEIYYRVTKNSQLQWVHPDIFATILSFNGHPTPLRSDFEEMSRTASVGLVFLFLEQRVYTLDAKSFALLNITDAKVEQKDLTLPFYTRVPKISSLWWGEGSGRLDTYEPHYYKLLIEANPQNRELYEIVKKSKDKDVQALLEEFDFEGKKDDRKKIFGLF